MNEQDQAYLEQVERELQKEQSINKDFQQQAASSMFLANQDTNLIEFQLELDNILERIDHLLRGHTIGFDDNGNLTWKEASDPDFAVFNEYGIQEVLRILSMYLNRNTILSNYDEETIKWKVYDFGMELTDLIFLKYEDMGLNTPEKRKLYPILVKEIVDTIHSSYLRALNGGERESLRSARMVTQSDNLMQQPYQMQPPQQNKFKLLRPTTWFGK